VVFDPDGLEVAEVAKPVWMMGGPIALAALGCAAIAAALKDGVSL
jgi:hypothetical protein